MSFSTEDVQAATSALDFYKSPCVEIGAEGTRYLMIHIAKSIKKHLFSKETLTMMFAPYGNICHIFMGLSGKKKAVIVFENAREAQDAKEAMGNVPHDALLGRRLYIEYGARKAVNGDGYCPFLKIPNVLTDVACIPEPSSLVPGLHILYDFITEAEEMDIMTQVDAGVWEVLNARRVMHFGYKFHYKNG